MSTFLVWTIITVVALGGFALRAAFLLKPLPESKIPARLEFLLELVPAAALSALVAPAVLSAHGRLQLISPASLAGLLALVVSIRYGNMALTMIIGLASYAAFSLIL